MSLDDDLALMRDAGRICTHAMNRAIQVMKPGVPQQNVIAAIYEAQTIGVPGAGGDYAAICPLMPVGEGTSTPHLTWTDKPLPNEALTMLEIAGARRRYHAPLTRTIYLGKPPQKMRDVAKVVVEGVERVEELEIVAGLGADVAQGYLLGRPIRVAEAIDLPQTGAVAATLQEHADLDASERADSRR